MRCGCVRLWFGCVCGCFALFCVVLCVLVMSCFVVCCFVLGRLVLLRFVWGVLFCVDVFCCDVCFVFWDRNSPDPKPSALESTVQAFPFVVQC